MMPLSTEGAGYFRANFPFIFNSSFIFCSPSSSQHPLQLAKLWQAGTEAALREGHPQGSMSAPEQTEKQDEQRQKFLVELEFVQCLANPLYIDWLATQVARSAQPS